MNEPLKILSYNIHKGFSPSNRKFVLNDIKQAIRLVGADIVFLQEVVGEHTSPKRRIHEWPTNAQFEFLADEIWPHFAYGKNSVYLEGHHGNAILSRIPILAWENLDISAHRVEQRGMLHAVVRPEGITAPLHLVCVHFGLFERFRQKQVQDLCARIEQHVPAAEPFLIAGDFNDRRQRVSAQLESAIRAAELFKSLHGRHPKTFPAWAPLWHLDRMYGRGLNIHAARVLHGRPWSRLSDHLALYAEVSLAKRQGEREPGKTSGAAVSE